MGSACSRPGAKSAAVAPAEGAPSPGLPKAAKGQKAPVAEAPGQLPPQTCIIFVLGGPGSGKGTQCQRIVKAYGFEHLSAGDLLRAEVESGGPKAAQLQRIMKEGQLVPDETMITLLKNAMLERQNDTFLIDGFPRSVEQAEEFERRIKPPTAVLFYDCPEDVMMERVLGRGQSGGRADDNEETAIKRIKTFQNQTVPVKQLYQRKGLCAIISAVPEVQEVFHNTKQALSHFVPEKPSKSERRRSMALAAGEQSAQRQQERLAPAMIEGVALA